MQLLLISEESQGICERFEVGYQRGSRRKKVYWKKYKYISIKAY